MRTLPRREQAIQHGSGATWKVSSMCDTSSYSRADTRLSRGCLAKVSRQLELLPALYEDCEHMLVARPNREVERVRGGLPGSATINEAAVSARSTILSTLASLAGLVRDERPVQVVLRREVAPLAAFLRAHLEWLTDHPAARELCEELDDAVDMAQRVTRPETGKMLEIGTCRTAGCGSTVYATIGAEPSRRPTLVSCDAGHHLAPRDWLLVMPHGAHTARRQMEDSGTRSVARIAS
jgi:hypothetical protein